MARYDDLHTGTITLVGIVSAVLTFVIIVAAQVLYYQYQDLERQRKVIDAPLAQTRQALEAQDEALNNYQWIDREKGIVSLPIDQAKQAVLEEMTSRDSAESKSKEGQSDNASDQSEENTDAEKSSSES